MCIFGTCGAVSDKTNYRGIYAFCLGDVKHTISFDGGPCYATCRLWVGWWFVARTFLVDEQLSRETPQTAVPFSAIPGRWWLCLGLRSSSSVLRQWQAVAGTELTIFVVGEILVDMAGTSGCVCCLLSLLWQLPVWTGIVKSVNAKQVCDIFMLWQYGMTEQTRPLEYDVIKLSLTSP